MEDKLKYYEKCREVPENAKKTIGGGRLKGMTDINPMWRIKMLTELFGPVGLGWKYVITKQWVEDSPTGERASFCNIDLFVKYGDTWSDAIQGTGGSMYIVNERNGAYTDDECFKKALTDAISVACKALGFGADVYWQADRTKYSERMSPSVQQIDESLQELLREIKEAATIERLVEIHRDASYYNNNQVFMNALSVRKKQLKK